MDISPLFALVRVLLKNRKPRLAAILWSLSRASFYDMNTARENLVHLSEDFAYCSRERMELNFSKSRF
jgi:hypothetical protein